MTRSYRYKVVDVFTQTPLEGNSLAVIPDAAGIEDATMQAIAREFNLSETTFVVAATRADCAARVRIFTPQRELAFAGHPTIGTSFVLMEEGIVPAASKHFSLEEKIGAVPIRVDSGERPMIWLRTPKITEGKTFDRASCAHALGLELADLLEALPQLVSAGNPTIFIPVKSVEAVDRAWLDSAGAAKIRQGHPEPACVFVFAPTPTGAYSRMFAPDLGVAEDPATGSATGPLAAYMMRHHLVSNAAGARFVSEQGTKMKRRSLLHVQIFGESGARVPRAGSSVELAYDSKEKRNENMDDRPDVVSYLLFYGHRYRAGSKDRGQAGHDHERHVDG
jgi:trans-2,3-dihydro-3-hydroxyanthranilate isomerase